MCKCSSGSSIGSNNRSSSLQKLLRSVSSPNQSSPGQGCSGGCGSGGSCSCSSNNSSNSANALASASSGSLDPSLGNFVDTTF